MSDQSPAPTQASLGTVRAGVIRHAINETVQVDATGVIPPFSFQPPGGTSGWARVRISNYSPYLFQVVGIPGGGSGDPPQLLQPFQQNVWNYKASRGTITLIAALEGSPLAVPPLRFTYEDGTAAGDELVNFVTVEWTDTPDLFFGYYPVPLVGVCIGAAVNRVSLGPGVVPVGSTPIAIALLTVIPLSGPVTRYAYVANSASHNVTVINLDTLTVTGTLDTVLPPTDIAFDTTNRKLYVARSGTHSVLIYLDGVIIGAVDVGADQTGICVDTVTHKKYVSLAGGNLVAVLSATDVHLGNIVVGADPKGLDANAATGQVYVSNSTDDTVSQIDEATDLVVGAPIAVGTTPVAVTCDTVHNRIYVANSGSDNVSDIDGATALVTATIGVGDHPIGIDCNSAVLLADARVYVANQGTNSVSVIGENTDTVIGTLAPGVGPTDVVIDTFADLVYVTIAADAMVILADVP